MNLQHSYDILAKLDIVSTEEDSNEEIPVDANTKSGVKYDSGKPDFSLISPIAITYLVKVLDFGATKYAAHNWRKGMNHCRLVSSIFRHMMAYLGGEFKDKESGLPHLAHIMCCAMFLLEYTATGLGTDDRYRPDSDAVELLHNLLGSNKEG
jgi:hypothetical protein